MYVNLMSIRRVFLFLVVILIIDVEAAYLLMIFINLLIFVDTFAIIVSSGCSFISLG